MKLTPSTHADTLLSATASGAVRWLTFPAALAIFALAAAALQSPWLPRPEPVHLLTFAATALLANVAERRLPFRAEWAQVPPAERRTDRTSLLALFAFADPLMKFVLMPALVSLGAAALAPLGAVQVFPSAAPLPVQLGIAVLLAELGSYSLHRLAHHLPALWGIHSFHHAPARLYWLNGFRVNPLNVAWHQLSSILVLQLLGAPAETVQTVVALGIVIAGMQHCNADVRYDGWNLLFATADLHRWHHALELSESGNYGAVTSVWDRVFGTYRRGHAGPAHVGIASSAPAAGGYLRELWLSYRLHSAHAQPAPTAPARGCGASTSNALCSTCPVPRDVPISWRQRVRSCRRC